LAIAAKSVILPIVILLCFAHAGEARVFIKNLNMAWDKPSQTYKNNKYILLITGEGIYKSIFNLSVLLTKENSITEIVNLGIAGSMNSNLALNQIIPIACSYNFSSSEPNFESFLINHNSKFNCLSVSRKIDKSNYHKSMEYFGTIIDMELWGLCFVAKQFNLPINSYKLISDYTTCENNTQTIISNSSSYSHMLFDYFKKQNCITKKFVPTNNIKDIFNDKKFYFTQSQKRIVDNIITHQLPDNFELAIQELKLKAYPPKKRTKLLINKFSSSNISLNKE